MILKLSTTHFLVKRRIVSNKKFCRTLILWKLDVVFSYILVLKPCIFKIMCFTMHLILHLP